jgi:hypothetical protein
MEQYRHPRHSKIITGYGNEYTEQELNDFLKILHNKAVDIQTSISTTPILQNNNVTLIHYSILITWQQINPE